MAELLVALLILAEIATFTIPKVLLSQQNGQNKAKTKELASMVAVAYQQYQLGSTAPSSNTKFADLTQYMAYLKVDSSTALDDQYGNSYVCGSAGKACLVFHSGAYLMYNPTTYFSNTNTTNMVYFWVDPDGGRNSTPSQFFFLTYPGRVVSSGDISVTYSCAGETHTPGSSPNASWFSW